LTLKVKSIYNYNYIARGMLNHIAISKAIYKVLLFFVKAALCDSEFYNISDDNIYFNINRAYSNAYWFVSSIYVNI